MALDLAGVMVSAGAACSSGKVRPSHVLTAMGASPGDAGSAIRISLGRGTRPRPTSPTSSRPGGALHAREPHAAGRAPHEQDANTSAARQRTAGLSRLSGDDADRSACWRPCCRGSPRNSATRTRPMASAGRRMRPSNAHAARSQALIGAEPREIVFTSGATEANNLAIKGAARFHRATRGDSEKDHIVTLATEHKCVLESFAALKAEGFSVDILPVRNDGLVDLEALAASIGRHTLLVSVMAVNNEIGTVQPIAEIGALCRSRGILFHTDAAQAAGKIPLDVEAMKLDLLSISGHKIYAPKGIGALYVRHRPRVRLEPLFSGGAQERGFRSGTLPAPLCIALGEACAIAQDEMVERSCAPRDAAPALPRCAPPSSARDAAQRRRRAAGRGQSEPRRFPGSTPKPCWRPALRSRPRPARPAPRPASSRPTCCGRSGSTRRRREARCGWVRPLHHRGRDRFRRGCAGRGGPPLAGRRGRAAR